MDKARAALYGFYIGDALAMPVHWYYNLRQLESDFGRISRYEAPKSRFPGSIMNLSNTGGGGRGSDTGSIVGDVILHGKKKYWERGGNYHYHHGMQAGENTLEAQLTRLITRSMTEKRAFHVEDYTQKYITFMTTPGTHNDVYASTCHRMFFANLVRGLPPNQCADNDGHNVDTIDGLSMLPPVIIACMDMPAAERSQIMQAAYSVTRNSRVLQSFAESYADLLMNVLRGADLRESVAQTGRSMGVDVVRMARQGDPMSACYIDSAFPAMLVLAYKYASSPTEAQLANANAGGENVARGSLLGALMGAAHGMEGFADHLVTGLVAGEEIMREIDAFLSVFCATSETTVLDSL